MAGRFLPERPGTMILQEQDGFHGKLVRKNDVAQGFERHLEIFNLT